MAKPKAYKGSVFFDIDGTLIDERLGITEPTEKTKQAIGLLKENGYLSGIATGRAKCYLPDLGIDFDCYVTCNGAVVEINNEIIVNEYIDFPKLEKLVDYLEANDFGYNIETRNSCRFGYRTRDKMFDMLNRFNINTACFEPLDKLDGIKANKAIVSFDNTEQFEKLKRDFASDFLITRHHTSNSGDVSIFDITKATGIAAAIAYANVSVENTYAFGDDGNDFEMLSFVGTGIAMTPHSELIDGVASVTTGSVGEEGIFNALIKLGLI